MIYGLRLRVAGAIFPQVKHTDKGNGKYVALITILSVCCGRSGEYKHRPNTWETIKEIFF